MDANRSALKLTTASVSVAPNEIVMRTFMDLKFGASHDLATVPVTQVHRLLVGQTNITC